MSKNSNHSSNGQKKNYLIVSNDGMARSLISFAYFRKRLNDLKLAGKVNLQAAGLIINKGIEADPLAVKILKDNDIPVAGFSVKQVDNTLLKKTDVVIALSVEDHNYLKHTYEARPNKIRILQVPVIIDRKEETYEKAFAKIQDGLDQELKSLSAR